MLSSGLSKLSAAKTKAKKSYRGEHSTSLAEIQNRINLVNQGGGLTDQPAFMSTSISRRIANGFRGNCLVVFDSVYGKPVRRFLVVLMKKNIYCRLGRYFGKHITIERGVIFFMQMLLTL